MDCLNLQKVAEYCGGTLLRGEASRPVPNVVTDSRSLQAGEVFLALIGDNFNGHRFISQAAAIGAVGVIVSEPVAADNLDQRFALIEVADTLLAYQRLAAAYRTHLPMRVVAITGSNGKTSTKDFTAAVLSQQFKVLKTEGNFNNHIGVPRTLLRAGAEIEVAVLEMGMNHPGELRPLANMAKPDVAIITNIGTAHIEHMGSREAIAQEKGVLVEAVGAYGHVILPAEDPFVDSLAARTAAKVLTAGICAGDFRAENVRGTLEGSHFDVRYAGQSVAASIGIPGEHMLVNALLAVAAGVALGMSLEDAAHSLQSAALTKGRLQLRRVGDFQIIDDSYNANPDSMVAALKTVSAVPVGGRRIAVLGKMGELGSHTDDGYRRVGRAAAESGFDCVITVGNEAALITRSAADAGVSEVYNVSDTDEAGRLLLELASSKDLILVKGSRSAGMERVIVGLAVSAPDPVAAAPSFAH